MMTAQNHPEAARCSCGQGSNALDASLAAVRLSHDRQPRWQLLLASFTGKKGSLNLGIPHLKLTTVAHLL